MRKTVALIIGVVSFLLAAYIVLFQYNDTAYFTAWEDAVQSFPVSSTGNNEIFKEFAGMDKPYEGPLPWEKDPEFQEALKRQGALIKLAAYKATLTEPIEAEDYNIALAADKLTGTVVKPGQFFSQNEVLGPYTVRKGYRPGPTYAENRLTTTIGGGVCKIASVLYNVVTFSDLEITMRFPHSLTVPYVPPGQDATVYYGVKDFRFKNNTDGPVLIWARKVGDTLYMAFYGCKPPPLVTWHHEIMKKIDQWTVYRYTEKLPAGEEQVLAGHDGFIVRSWVEVQYPGAEAIVKNKGVSFYNPCPRIIERGISKKK